MKELEDFYRIDLDFINNYFKDTIKFSHLLKQIVNLKKKTELHELFGRHCKAYNGNDWEKVMTFEELKNFINLVQGDNLSSGLVKQIIWDLNVEETIYGLLLGIVKGNDPNEVSLKKKKTFRRRNGVFVADAAKVLKRSTTVKHTEKKNYSSSRGR